MLSTRHNTDFEVITSKNTLKKTRPKPSCIVEYNSNMGGVDKSVQMTTYYSTPCKTMRWYLKIFLHLLDLCAWNSSILYNFDKPKKLQKNTSLFEILSLKISLEVHLWIRLIFKQISNLWGIIGLREIPIGIVVDFVQRMDQETYQYCVYCM